MGHVKTRVLRKIFGPKRDEETGECRRFHIEELYDLYLPPNIMRVCNKEEWDYYYYYYYCYHHHHLLYAGYLYSYS